MGLPELKSMRRFGLGRRIKEPDRTVKEPERRPWRSPAESNVPAAGGRTGVPFLQQDRQQRDPAALRAYTTPNICVQGGRIEFIQNSALEKRAVASTLPNQSTVSSERGTQAVSPASMSPSSSVTKLGRGDVKISSFTGRRQESQTQVVSPASSVTKILRDVTLSSREKRDVAQERPRDAASLRHGTVTSRVAVMPVTTESVTRPVATPLRSEKSAATSAVTNAVKESTVGVDKVTRDDHGRTSGRGFKRIPTLVPKEKKEEDNQERRNTRPPMSASSANDPVPPVRSPTPVRRLSKVRAKVAQFEQLGGAKDPILLPPTPPAPPATTPISGDITNAQSNIEEELNNLERGLEEECLNFRRWNRLAQRSAGESRSRQNRHLLNMSVENDRCRDRIFSMQDELQRSEDRARAAELARSEADKKLTAMDSLMKAHEAERQHWLSQVHQLTLQLERLKTSSPEPDAPTRADLEVKVRSLELERQEQERRSDRCLDELANQIVQALSKQKSLQSGLARLRRRIHELEHENAVLYSLLGRESTTTVPLLPPAHAQAPPGSTDEEEMTAICAKVRRLLEEHYTSPSGCHAAQASLSPLRWSQFAALLSADSTSSFSENACALCASLPCDTDSRLRAPDTRTAASLAAAPAGCSPASHRQAADSDVMRRLCEVADTANAAQRRLASLGASKQCSVPRTSVTSALTDAEKCATLAALPVKLSELPRTSAEHVNSLSSKRSPELSTRSSSCPPSRDESKREEGRDEGYSTMSSDVQANVSADSGVSVSGVGAEASSESRPRLEDVREVQEEGVAAPEVVERPPSSSSSDSEDLRSLVQALRQSLRPGRRLRASADRSSNIHVDAYIGSPAHARYSCVLPSRPRRPVHRCRSDSRLFVKRWTETAASLTPRPWDAPERSTSTLELGAASTIDARRSSSLKRAAAEESLERPPVSPPAAPVAFIPAALPWRDDSSELWRNCFSLESAGDMEDWSLSAEELRSEMTDEGGGGADTNRVAQADSSDYSRVGSFSNIQEAILELEEDSSECLWNNASYMTSNGGPAALPGWPYELTRETPTPVDYHPLAMLSPTSEEAPRCSWSSSEQLNFADISVLDFNDDSLKKGRDSDCKLGDSLPRQCDLKRLSNGSDAMSCASVVSEDGGDNNLETDFTRDFYRLVKYESSKSLALSETSVKGDDEPEPISTAEREMALSSMLDFISEQQRYIEQRESQDQRYIDQQQSPDLPEASTSQAMVTDSSCSDSPSTLALERSSSSTASVLPADPVSSSVVEPAGRGVLDGSIHLAQLTRKAENKATSPSPTVTSSPSTMTSPTVGAVQSPVIVYRAEISTNHKAYTPTKDNSTSNAGVEQKSRDVVGISEVAKDSLPASNGKQPPKSGIPRSPLVGKRKRTAAVAAIGNQSTPAPRGRPPGSPKLTAKLKRDSVRPVPETPPVVAKTSLPSPKLLRRLTQSRAEKSLAFCDPAHKRSESSPAAQRRPESPARRTATTTSSSANGVSRTSPTARPTGSRIPRLRGSRSTDSRVEPESSASGGRSAELVRAISEPAEIACGGGTSPLIVRHGDVTSFHRRATSRQLIDELRRLSALEAKEEEGQQQQQQQRERNPDGEGCDTGWVRVDQHVGYSQDGSDMYDVMLASHGSSDSSSDDDVIPQPASEYQHLKWVHQARRRKQVSRRKDGALRYTPVFRPPIHNRPEFFFRYGPQERAALATFDFLDGLPSSSSTSDVTVSSPVTSRR